MQIEQHIQEFAALLETQRRVYLGYVMKFAQFDRFTSEDIVQIASVKAFVALQKGQYSQYIIGNNVSLPLSIWFVKILRNTCIDYIRQISKSKYTDVDLQTLKIATQSESDDAEYLLNAINTLPVEQHSVVHMRTHLDMQFNEIADVMKTSINTAIGRYRYAVINLRKILQHEKKCII